MPDLSPRRRRGFPRPTQGHLGVICVLVVAVLVGTYFGLLINSRPHLSGDRLRIDSFFELASAGRIRDARLLDQDAFVVGDYVRDDGSVARYRVPYLKEGGALAGLIDTLVADHIPTSADQQTTKQLIQPASLLLPALIVVVVFVYLILSYQRGSGLFAITSGAARVKTGGAVVRFSDVAGQGAAVEELREIRDFLSDPGRFLAAGAKMPKGILLFGPPGCGKTLLARAVAGEAGAAFYSISGSDFVELYVGVGAARVRELFREARQHVPAIVFIDELDSVGGRRGGRVGASAQGEQEQALNQILAELDGFSPMEGIIVLAATNRPDVLDPALLRPGRFDRAIGLERPDEQGRTEILALHSRQVHLDDTVDLHQVARRAIGLSGADLASLINEAALLTARAGRETVSTAEVDLALVRILEAPERQRRLSMRTRSFYRSTGSAGRVSFADVAGIDEVLAELVELRDYLAEPERFSVLGARPPRGVLLVGPPGCGKTLLARAVATEANAAFFSVAASEFVEIFSGEGPARVRDLFAEARAVAPAIVFLDELDAIGARRGASADGHREREQTLNQILIELDGFEVRSQVVVVGATNRPEILDPALVRAGRFDRTIAVDLPDRRARRAILELHAREKRLAPDVDLDGLAVLTQGFSGADLANVLNEAALLAGRDRLSSIPAVVIDEALDRVRLGPPKGTQLGNADRSIIAYHEAGHAIVAWALPGAADPHRVSIVSRGATLGATTEVDATDRALLSKAALIDRMAALQAGRAAEEMIFGEAGSGSSDDLRRSSDIARRMVCEWGMSEALGARSYADTFATDGREYRMSEGTAAVIDDEIGRLVDLAQRRARTVLDQSQATLRSVASALLDNETLAGDQLAGLLGARRNWKWSDAGDADTVSTTSGLEGVPRRDV